MKAEISRLKESAARQLMATGIQRGDSLLLCSSGTFLMRYELPDGSSIEHSIDHGWLEKFILVPAGYQSGPMPRHMSRMM